MFVRGNNRHLNLQEKGFIAGSISQGASQRSIAQTYGIDRKTVRLWANRYEETGNVLRQAGSGRPRKTTPDEDLRLIQQVAAKPITSAAEIAGRLILFYYWVHF